MNGHRREGKKVRSGHNEVDALEFNRSLHKIISVDVTVKAVFDAVFVEHVDYLTAEEVGENGREVKESEKLFATLSALGSFRLQTLALLKTHFETHRLAVDYLFIVGLGVANGALLGLIIEPAAASADDKILGLKSVVVEHVNCVNGVFFKKTFHFRHC